MDLSALLAREGIKPGDVDALMKWARQRSTALIARIEPGSPLAEALGAAYERTRDSNGAPVPVSRTPSRSAPRAVARGVSRPYLGAAVEAALSGKQEDLDLALETAAAEAEAAASGSSLAVADFEPEVELAVDIPVLEDSPPPAPTEPDPTAVPDENDPYIGGFNRFAQNFRRREMEAQARAQAQAPTRSPLPDGQTLSRGFERHAEEQTPKTGWDHEFLPEPPGFEARQRARRSAVPEPSGLLVLGIPDEEGGDVPVRRVRPYSAGLGKRPAPDSGPSESFSAELAMLDEASELLPIAHAQPGPPDDALGHDPTPGPFDDDDAAPIARPASVPFDDDDAAPVARPTPAPFDDDDAAPFVAKPAPGPYDDDDDAAPFVAKPASGPYDDDDDAAPFVAGPETVAHAPSGPQPDAPQAATHALSGPYDDDDDAPPAAAHAHSGPHGSGPQAVAHATSGPQSGPQAAARPISGPQHSSGPHRGPPPPPPPRNGPAPGNSAKRTPPPPPPRDAVKVTRTKTASASPVPPADPKARRAKPVKKKVVELSQPVARPISAPVVMAPVRPSAAPSERSGHRPIPADDEVLHPQSVPDYLRDDDE